MLGIMRAGGLSGLQELVLFSELHANARSEFGDFGIRTRHLLVQLVHMGRRTAGGPAFGYLFEISLVLPEKNLRKLL